MRPDVVASSPSALAARLLQSRSVTPNPPAVATPPASAPGSAEPPAVALQSYDFAGRPVASPDPRPTLDEASRLLTEGGQEHSREELERAQERSGTLLDVLA